MSTLLIPGETARRIKRRHKWPPFVKVTIAKRGIPAYEDSIYESNALIVKQESGEAANLDQRFAILERLNPFANRQSPSIGINSREQLKGCISDALASLTDDSTFNLDKAEAWIIHGTTRESTVTKLTASLPMISSAVPYPGATLRGGLSIGIEGRRLVIPVYLWLDNDYGSQIHFFVNEPDNPTFFVSVPEGYE